MSDPFLWLAALATAPVLAYLLMWLVYVALLPYGSIAEWRRHRREAPACPCCRGYPVIWVDPCTAYGHAIAYDCPGHTHDTPLCNRHADRWLRIHQMEREVLGIPTWNEQLAQARHDLAAKLRDQGIRLRELVVQAEAAEAKEPYDKVLALIEEARLSTMKDCSP